MAAQMTTFSDTEEQRTQCAAKSDVSLEVTPIEPVQASDAPNVATAALRDFVRALARAAARRDWEAAVQRLNRKEPTDDPQNDTSAR